MTVIEKIVLDYLNDVLSVPAYTEKPEEPPIRYVIIEKTGGSTENFINSATLALQSHAESLFLAAELNEEVINAMDNIIVLDDIAKSKYNTDYNFTDTSKKEYRYQAVYDLTY